MSATAAIKKTPGTASQDYTFLVGENVYLRTFHPGDELNATSWRNSIFPKSPELVEKWIKEELPKEGKHKRNHLAIVRKSDDVIIGSMMIYNGDVGIRVNASVDPLYGEIGQRWLVEALTITAEWQVVENHQAKMDTEVSSDQDVAYQQLLQAGFVETARWRGMLEKNGQRYDCILMSYLNSAWVDRIGHPMEMELPRTGTGEVRPVPTKVTLEGDPPANAVIVGQRVYLRPEDKKDAEYYTKAGRMEDEAFWDIGRHLFSQASMEKWITSNTDDDHPKFIEWAVCLRETDEVIGSVCLLDTDYVNRTAETGSWFHESKNRGNGYGSEAKQLLLEYAFEVLGLYMVRSFVYFPNTRSAAALRKQGYRESGRLCWGYPYEGGFGNMVTFDLLASEWRALPREAAITPRTPGIHSRV